MTTGKIGLLSALRDARSALEAARTAEPGEAAVAKRLARELDEAIQRLEGREPEKDLVSIVCHDLKDPLASIVMGAGFLRKSLPEEDRANRRVVDAIARSAERMNHVVADFHDLAKLEASTLRIDIRPCDVAAALEGALVTFAAQAGERQVSLDVEVPAGPMQVLADRSRLVQIVTKLVGNALKFTSAGGRVTIRVASDGGRVRVSVQDTGRGMPAEKLEGIFDRAVNARRTPRDGPGLGLAIARELVELQGGEIGVESRVGEGSLFWFTLPAAPSPA